MVPESSVPTFHLVNLGECFLTEGVVHKGLCLAEGGQPPQRTVEGRECPVHGSHRVLAGTSKQRLHSTTSIYFMIIVTFKNIRSNCISIPVSFPAFLLGGVMVDIPR